MNKTFLTSIVSILLFGNLAVGCDEKQEKDESGQESTKSDESQDSAEQESSDDDDDESSSLGDDDDSTGGETEESTGTGEEIPDEFKGKNNPYDTDDSDIVSEGEDLYSMICASCHGRNGEGSVGPSVSDSKAAAAADDFYLWKITDGVGTDMPPQKDNLSEEEIWKIVTFVRVLQN